MANNTIETAEATAEATPAEETANAEAIADPAADPDDATDEPRTEAAKYRRRLRDAEAERDALAEKVESLQRQHVESVLKASGVKPAAVFAVADLPALLADDGTVDADKVTAAVAAAREQFGIAPISKGSHVPGVGNMPSTAPKADGWKDAFTPPRGR